MAVMNWGALMQGAAWEQLPSAVPVIDSAIRERYAALAATNQTNPYQDEDHYFDGSPPPTVDGQAAICLYANSLAQAVRRLGNYYLDADAYYIPGSFSNFPQTLADAMKASEEHPLTASVARCDSWGTEGRDAFGDFKTMLEDCAYWLNRMTRLVVPSRYLTATISKSPEGSESWSSFPLSADFSPVSGFEESEESRFADYSRSGRFYWFKGLDRPYSSETHRGRIYDGWAVDNRTPFDTDVEFYLVNPAITGRDRDKWKAVNKWNGFRASVELCDSVEYDEDWDDYTATRITHRTKTIAETESGEVELLATTLVQHQRESGEMDTHTTVETNYTFDVASAFEYYRDEYESEPILGHWYPDNEFDLWIGTSYAGIPKWDGFGLWSNPATPRIVPLEAHSKRILLTDNSPRLPSINFDSYKSKAGYTRGSYNWDEDYSCEWSPRLIAVFNFGNAFTTFAGLPHKEQEE